MEQELFWNFLKILYSFYYLYNKYIYIGFKLNLANVEF